MNVSPRKGTLRRLAEEFVQGSRTLPRVWGRRDAWQVRLRWWVPPAIVAGVLIARWVGFDIETRPVIAIAVFILAYNIAIALHFARAEEEPEYAPTVDRPYAILQVSLDYIAIVLLIHFTGGPYSPLIFFFIFHVISAGILFRPSTAWLFAVLATVGLGLLTLGKSLGWLPRHPLLFRGEPAVLSERPAHLVVMLLFFTASVFITAGLTTAIMRRLRERVIKLAETSEEVAALNEKLNSLFTMLSAVGAERRLEHILKMVTSELADAMRVPVVTVKLLGDDGKTLRYAAAYGMPADFSEGKVIDVARSPLNRRVIEGETLVFGEVASDQTFQFQDDLLAAGIGSVVFAPLTIEGRVIGILGAYSRERDYFSRTDTGFFRLAAELVAVAIENGRAYLAIEKLMQEKSQFMLRVAHNIRTPVTSSITMLDLVRGGYVGEVDEKQEAQFRRIDRRLRNLNATVAELSILARSREKAAAGEWAPVQLNVLAERLRTTFGEEAARKRIAFGVTTSEDLPEVKGNADMLEQVLENLASNAIKYTLSGGIVDVVLAGTDSVWVRIEVRDTGIGIPKEEQPLLYTEFFRASNARQTDEAGTGLGLAIVKQIVDLHGGRIYVASEEGKGTTVTVDLPASHERAVKRADVESTSPKG